MPLSSFLETQPQAAWQTQMLKMGSPMNRYFDYNDIYNQYLAHLANRQAQGIMVPEWTFSDFLSKYPWERKYSEASPRERGYFPSNLVGGAARFLNY